MTSGVEKCADIRGIERAEKKVKIGSGAASCCGGGTSAHLSAEMENKSQGPAALLQRDSRLDDPY